MTKQRVSLQPAYLLHSRPYRETSAIIEVFTPEYGRVSLVAKGLRRKKSPLQPLLQLYRPLLLSWQGRGTLMTMVDAEPHGSMYQLTGIRLMSAFYINELLVRLLTHEEPHPELFAAYSALLETFSDQQLDAVGVEKQLRYYERLLLDELGYGLILDHDGETGEVIQADRRYHYLNEVGPVAWRGDDYGGVTVHGSTLLALLDGSLNDKPSLKEAKRLMRALLSMHLGNKPLHSRELMKKIV